MSDLVLSTGERVPELAETAVVHEDGAWRLWREPSGRYTLEKMVDGRAYALGFAHPSLDSRVWAAHAWGKHLYIGDLDQAIGRLWAARGTA